MKKYFGFIFSIVLVLIMFLYTLYVNSTMKNDNELMGKIKEIPYDIPPLDDESFLYDLENYEVNENDLIAVKVKLNKHVKFIKNTRISEFDILSKYNASDFTEDTIYIAENISYNENRKVFNILDFNIIPMVEGSEYIVLLNSQAFEDYKNLLDKKVYRFYGNTNKVFSKINLDATKNVDTETLSYDDLDDYLPVANDRQKEAYLERLNKILEELNFPADLWESVGFYNCLTYY